MLNYTTIKLDSFQKGHPLNIKVDDYGTLTIPDDITALESAHLTQFLIVSTFGAFVDYDGYIKKHKLERLFVDETQQMFNGLE